MNNTTTADLVKCPYCSGVSHTPEMCPMVKAVEYYQNGSIKRLEFGSRFGFPVVSLPQITSHPNSYPHYVPSVWPTPSWQGNT